MNDIKIVIENQKEETETLRLIKKSLVDENQTDPEVDHEIIHLISNHLQK